MKVSTLLQATVVAFAATSDAALGRLPHGSAMTKRQTSNTANYKPHYFEQMINHFPDSTRYKNPLVNETFTQRYFFDASYYKPGGPVLLYIGGETSAESRFEFMQTGIIKMLMEATNGLGVILENRYYGDSVPFPNSTTDNLRFSTQEQTIADNAYFAQHATFPGVSSNTSLNAPKSAWILYGGSLAGAETAWSLKTYGGDEGILWAGIAASGTTHARLEYPQWYAPVQKFGPQDCVASITNIVANMDAIFDSGDADMVHKMKEIFGLETLSDGDFAQTIAWPIGGPFNYPTYTWQELNWDPEVQSYDFWYFCENVTNINAPENITKVDYALSSTTNGAPWPGLGNWANYIQKYVIDVLCEGIPVNSSWCAGTQDQEWWANVTTTATRSYLYMMCTEYGLYQTAPKHGPSLVTNPLNINYTQQWCTWAFPPGQYNSIPSTPDLESLNKYGGLNVSQVRLAHVDGNQDVWLDICYHSNDAPERLSTSLPEEQDHPQLLITGSGHHWDSYGLDGLAGIPTEPQFIRAAHLWEIRTVERWMREWHACH